MSQTPAAAPSEISDVRSSIHSQPAIEALDAYKRRDGSKGAETTPMNLSAALTTRYYASPQWLYGSKLWATLQS